MNDLEDVHRLLDAIDTEISRLKEETRREIDVLKDTGDLCLIASEVVGWFTAYSDVAVKVGISAPG